MMTNARPGDPNVIGGNRVLRQLGRGGMGEVYLAWTGLRLVAVKVLNAQHADDHEFVKMFLAEARVAARINHTGIAQVLDVGMDEGRLYMVMEYVAGQTLDELLRDQSIPGLLPLRITASMFAFVAHSLAAAHRGKIVHRDISPHNLLISDTGAVKLIDFGIARAQNSDEHTSPGIFRGRFGYMAPEYVQSLPFDHRVDLFALGVVMWETFARQRLYSGTAAALFAMVQRPAERLDELLPGFPIELADVVARLLQRDPALRYANADDVAADLDALAPKLPDDGFRNLEHWMTHHLGSRIEARQRNDRDDLLRIAGTEALSRLTMNLRRRPGGPSTMPEPESELAVGTLDADFENEHNAEPTVVEGTGQRKKKLPRRIRRDGWPSATEPPPMQRLVESQAVPLPVHEGQRSAPIAIHDGHRSVPVPVTIYDGQRSAPVAIHDGHRSAPIAIHDGHRSAPVPVYDYDGQRSAPIAIFDGQRSAPVAIHDGHRSAPVAVPPERSAPFAAAPAPMPAPAMAPAPLPVAAHPLAPSDGFAALVHEQRRGLMLIAVLSAIVVVLSLILGLRGEWRARKVEWRVRQVQEAVDRQEQRADPSKQPGKPVPDARTLHDNDAAPDGPR